MLSDISTTKVTSESNAPKTNGAVARIGEARNRKKRNRWIARLFVYFSFKRRTRVCVFVDPLLYSRSRLYVLVRAARERECASKHNGRQTAARFSLLPPLSLSSAAAASVLFLSTFLSVCGRQEAVTVRPRALLHITSFHRRRCNARDPRVLQPRARRALCIPRAHTRRFFAGPVPWNPIIVRSAFSADRRDYRHPVLRSSSLLRRPI